MKHINTVLLALILLSLFFLIYLNLKESGYSIFTSEQKDLGLMKEAKVTSLKIRVPIFNNGASYLSIDSQKEENISPLQAAIVASVAQGDSVLYDHKNKMLILLKEFK